MKEKGRKARYEGVKDAYLSYGGDEIFSAAAQSTAQCVISYGAKVTLEIAEGMYHTYVVMPFAKEAKPKANCVFDGRKTLKNGKRRPAMKSQP